VLAKIAVAQNKPPRIRTVCTINRGLAVNTQLSTTRERCGTRLNAVGIQKTSRKKSGTFFIEFCRARAVRMKAQLVK
jgi:hypothetical protein